MQESKQKAAKVVSLVNRMAESLPSVSIYLKVNHKLLSRYVRHMVNL